MRRNSCSGTPALDTVLEISDKCPGCSVPVDTVCIRTVCNISLSNYMKNLTSLISYTLTYVYFLF